jgi:hypothetical protein
VLGDFPELHSVAQTDVTDFCLVYHDFSTRLERLNGLNYPREFSEVMKPFLVDAGALLTKVDEELKNVERVFCETAEYLGEDLSGYYGVLSAPSMDDGEADKEDRRILPMEMFGKLDLFFSEFREAGDKRKAAG